MPLPLALLLACSGSSEESGQTGSSTLPDAAWGATEVEERLSTMLDTGLPDPASLLDGFMAMFEYGDPRCPAQVNYTMVNSFDGCTSEQGYVYAGVSTYGPMDDGFWLLGDCSITDDQGQTFYCAGELELVTEEAGWLIELTGTWGYAGSDVPWIAAVPGLALFVTADESGLTLDGSYGLGDTYAYFEQVRVEDGAATGPLWLRDESGGWHTLALDGACGALSYGGQDEGEACVDLSAAVADLRTRVE